MIELTPQEFSNTHMAPWAQVREEMFGDTIKPKQLFAVETEDGPHHVAWSEYTMLDFNTGKLREGHHVMCDCAAIQGAQDDVGANIRCAHLGMAFLEKGIAIKEQINKLPTDRLISDGLARAIGSEAEDPLTAKVLFVLEDDLKHPEIWHANIFSGRHNITMLSRILRLSERTLQKSLRPIEELGVISIHGNVVKLNLAEQ